MSDLAPIEEILPHRPPAIYLTEITALNRDEEGNITGAEGYWQLPDANHPLFSGHFPNIPILMGVNQIESLAQVGAYAALQRPEFIGRLLVLGDVRGRFKRPMRPDERIDLTVALRDVHRIYGRGRGIATMGGKVCCEADITYVAVDREIFGQPYAHPILS